MGLATGNGQTLLLHAMYFHVCFGFFFSVCVCATVCVEYTNSMRDYVGFSVH